MTVGRHRRVDARGGGDLPAAAGGPGRDGGGARWRLSRARSSRPARRSRRPERLFDPATTVHGLRAAQVAVVGPAPPARRLALPRPARRPRRPGPVEPRRRSPGGAPGRDHRGDDRGEPDAARRAARSPGGPIRPATGSRSRRPPASPSTRCAPGCRCGCGPSAPTSGAASRRRTSRARRGPVAGARLPGARLALAARARCSSTCSRRDPDADLSIADPTVTLLELFAHVGDLLHYRLDRVATEAYLETARLRTSVRRHARLVDFALREAASARADVRARRARRRGRRR